MRPPGKTVSIKKVVGAGLRPARHAKRFQSNKETAMFTGIVEEIGVANQLQQKGQGFDLSLASKLVHADAKLGDSIAVNGVCLTVTHLSQSGFSVGLSPETRSRTNLVELRQEDPVNLERALLPGSRLGGHFVQGHIDGTGFVTALRRDQDSLWVSVQATEDLMRYIVPKGFVALDGVSLTVVDVSVDTFTVSLVAYTQQHITLPTKKAGYKINIEVDILGKYVEKMLANRSLDSQKKSLDLESLAELGYR
jgi:riboflavin synthase